jgi:hypothetical protein
MAGRRGRNSSFFAEQVRIETAIGLVSTAIDLNGPHLEVAGAAALFSAAPIGLAGLAG